MFALALHQDANRSSNRTRVKKIGGFSQPSAEMFTALPRFVSGAIDRMRTQETDYLAALVRSLETAVGLDGAQLIAGDARNERVMRSAVPDGKAAISALATLFAHPLVLCGCFVRRRSCQRSASAALLADAQMTLDVNEVAINTSPPSYSAGRSWRDSPDSIT